LLQNRSMFRWHTLIPLLALGVLTGALTSIPGALLVLLLLTFLVGAIALASGRPNVMQGAVHLVTFAAALFLALVP